MTIPVTTAAAFAPQGPGLKNIPANAKTALVKHIGEHDAQVAKKIVGVESVDHPSDAQLVARARKYFKAEDRMLPQKG